MVHQCNRQKADEERRALSTEVRWLECSKYMNRCNMLNKKYCKTT